MIRPPQPTIEIEARRYAFAAGVTNFTHKRGLSELAKGLKLGGLPLKMIAVYPMLGVNQYMSKLNFINPVDRDGAYRLTFSNSPTMSYRGVDWNGTNQTSNTNLNPSAIGAPMHVSYYSRENTNTATDQIDIGCTDNVTSLWVSCYYNASGFTSSLSRNNSNSVLLTGTNVSSAAWYVSSKVGTANALYRNAVSLTTATDSAATPAANLFIGSHNGPGGPILYTNRQCAFASAGLGVTAAEVIVLYRPVQICQIILWGRNV